jgi:hypothetical protein
MNTIFIMSSATSTNFSIKPQGMILPWADTESLFENYPYCGWLRLPMAASATKMGFHRSLTTLPAPFFRFLALENLAQPRDEIIIKQALRKSILSIFRNVLFLIIGYGPVILTVTQS